MILSVLMLEFIFHTSLNIIFVSYEVIKTYFYTLVKTVVGSKKTVKTAPVRSRKLTSKFLTLHSHILLLFGFFL